MRPNLPKCNAFLLPHRSKLMLSRGLVQPLHRLQLRCDNLTIDTFGEHFLETYPSR